MHSKGMLWKEWRQNRALFFYMLAAFMTLAFTPTIIESLRYGYLTGFLEAPPYVILLVGPLLTLVAGVSALSREQGRLEVFWYSRPVRLRTWLLTKYRVGMGVVVSICGLVLMVESLLLSCGDIRGGGVGDVLKTYAFFLLLMYSISFFMGALVQGTVNAAILSACTILLFIMAPLVLPPLHWISVNMIWDLARGGFGDNAAAWIPFVATTTAFSVLLLCLSGVVLMRRIRLCVDQRILCGLVLAFCLLFVAAVAFPLGTNMTCEQKIVLPRQYSGYVYDVIPDGNQALVLYSDAHEKDNSARRSLIARVDLARQVAAVHEPIVVAGPGSEAGVSYAARDLMWSKQRPQLAYVLVQKNRVVRGRQGRQWNWSLCTVSLSRSKTNPIIHRISLDKEIDEYIYPQACLFQQRIYVYDYRRVLVYGLEEPQTPILLYSQELDSTGPGKRFGVFLRGSGGDLIKLLPIAQLSNQGRLALTCQFCGHGWHLLGEHQVVLDHDAWPTRSVGLVMYRLGAFENGAVTLARQGRQNLRPVDRLLAFLIRPHEVFARHERAVFMSRYGVSVYDVADPNHIQRLGHYAAGEALVCMAPLANDRMIIGGENLHILKFPGTGK